MCYEYHMIKIMIFLYKCSVLVLLAVPFVKSNHNKFRGGLLSWKAINETQITIHHRLSFVYNDSCPNRNSSASIGCFPGGGCNDSTTMIGVCKESNSIENWADSEGDTNFTITNSTSTNLYSIGYSGFAWILLAYSANSWSLRMTVDVSTRTDNGRINQSPVSAMASSIIVGNSCNGEQIIIPVADYDGDNVRCRLPATTEECGDICNKTSILAGIFETLCELYIVDWASDGIYAMAIQIEDFQNSTSTTPLSSIPLQFIITVTSDGACYYSPNFISPTPTEGTVIQVHNGSLQFKARARISFSPESISRFHILSPLDFTISAISYPVLYEYETTISKTDILAEEIGIHVVCFSAESNYRRSTGSRCITVNITDIDECADSPCQNNGTCADLINGYECSCAPGLNGTNCEEDIDECAENPCQNNGTCLDLINDYQCNCVAGFNDTNCTSNIDECAENPCQNNGTCVDLINDYNCSCGAGFNGTDCEENIDECADSPCQNNGTCADLINAYECSCAPGFNGTNCEEDINECAENPCQNNGTCLDLINDYQCNCVAGFNDTNCTNNIDECAENPCQNNGTCVDLINDYNCSCEAGFNGPNCEKNTDECAENPCQNNGTCLDLINDYQCNCAAGFDDTNCTNNVDECTSLPCQNNGTCVDLINEYECQCDVEFNGTDCSTKSNLMKYTLVLNLDVTTTENLSIEEDYIKVKNKVQVALTDVYSKRIVGSKVVIKSFRKGSLIVDFDLVIPDSPTSKVLVVDTVYKLVNGMVFVNFSGEIVNVTTASIQHSTYGKIIIANSSDGCAVVNSQGACDVGYSCQEFINHTVACIPIINCS